MTFIYTITRDASDRDWVFVKLEVVNDNTKRVLGVMHMRRDEMTEIERATLQFNNADSSSCYEFDYTGEDYIK